MAASPTHTTNSASRRSRLIRDFSQDDKIPNREDDDTPRPLESHKVSTQSSKTPPRMKEEDSWLDEEAVQSTEIPRRGGPSIEQAPHEEMNVPVIEGPLDVPASSAPRSRSPPAIQQYQSIDRQSTANTIRSRSPPSTNQYQGLVFDDEPRKQALTYDGDRTIKKYLGPRDAESVAETEVSYTSSTKLANFFGLEVFQIVLHNPTTSHQLSKFCQSRFCAENMEFLERIDRYNALLDELGTTMLEIHKNFFSVNAPAQLNLSTNVMTKMNKDLKSALSNALPKMESLFTSAQTNTENLVFSDIYPRFVRHQLIVSATKALASDRSKYAGLGDCFVLTNPAKADNPIVFASDGFVSVTGYSRRDIIPRNCRFLQGRHTDQEAVGRLRTSIENREESVELLLNYKKNKEPFWNLLYTAPLYDENGNVAFFIGGQINCSTTIHSASDILRILSYSEDVCDKDEKEPEPVTARKSTFGKGLIKAFRGESATEIIGNKEVGMENALLNKIDKFTIKKQMETFHSAYSKVRKHSQPNSSLTCCSIL